MGTRTTGTMVLAMAMLGSVGPVQAQRPHATIDAAAYTAPGYRSCTRVRVRPHRGRRACAVPRRNAAFRSGYVAPSPWIAVGWGSARAFGPIPLDGFLNPGQLKRTVGRSDYRRFRQYARPNAACCFGNANHCCRARGAAF